MVNVMPVLFGIAPNIALVKKLGNFGRPASNPSSFSNSLLALSRAENFAQSVSGVGRRPAKCGAS
jgi:hypothetical protein